MYGQKYEPEYNAGFPAKRITTPLEWEGLVLPYNLREELDDIICWIKNQQEIREKWQLDRIVRQGYQCLFYGLPREREKRSQPLCWENRMIWTYTA
ncbi:hypothetical protein [Bacteroides fragilis]|jgi:hypothetical protein|uniref:hypothetical protein n=1 Tax=Bacteroides fragilis TaxID=817 RepID=UPI00209664C7|nr:hypothetical protein [Bacteroides fragilis]